MKRFFTRTTLLLAVAMLPLGCISTAPQDSGSAYPESVYDGYPGIWVPANAGERGQGTPRLPMADSLSYAGIGPYPVNLGELTPMEPGPDLTQLMKSPDTGRIESQISDELADLLREEALLAPPSMAVQMADFVPPEALGPAAGVSFDSLDANDCCGGGLNVPADSELAAGQSHVIAVVNVAFEIYNKDGSVARSPTTFSSFFSGVPNCSGVRVFDPNVIYDEQADRFILAIDADGTDYCIATSPPGNPLGTWNRYSFATDVGGNFFDYPHAGVGLDAIYLGANMFASSFVEGRVWAINKADMYGGLAPTIVTRSTGSEGTPQPMNLHGWAQGTWPVSGPHYILTDGPFNGYSYGVWTWANPFGANTLTDQGTVNLNAATGVIAGFPVDAPQLGSSIILQANDWRVQDAEYRNGYIWMANTQTCNPGSGVVDCIRWAQIDPTGPSVVDAGVYGSNGQYRIFADVAADDCDNMAIGYTKTSASTYPAVWVSGRESTDAPGTLQSESLLKAGERDYDSFQGGLSHRWGDYSGMTIDPDGTTFWYMGQYSKDITNFNTTTWGNYIGSFSFASCDDPVGPQPATNPSPGNGATDVSVDADLGWSAGAGATSHDVYFGIDPTPDAGEFQGNQPGTSFEPGTLTNSTTYYWRINEVNAEGTTTGAVWSFTTEAPPLPPPGPATNPSPGNDASDVSVEANLAWSAGTDAASHDVYFGTSPAPAFQGNQTGTGFEPGTLANLTTYYWRIDEVNATGTTTGTLWSFTTEDVPPPDPTMHLADLGGVSEPARRGRWNAIVTITVEDADDAPVSNVQVDGLWSNGTSGGGTCNTSGGNVCQVQKSNLKSNVASVDFTVTNMTAAGYDYDAGANEVSTTVTVFKDGPALPPGQATNPSPGNSATDVSIDANLGWSAGTDATSHNVYFGIDATPDAGEFQGNQGGTSFEPGTLAGSTTYFWRIDEVNAVGTTTGMIWSFTTGTPPPLPGPASSPSPGNDTTDVSVNANLGWSAGSNADSHDVYFGTDATPDIGEFKGNQGGTSFDPGTLASSTTYSWRIDEVNGAGTTTGLVWSFTTEATPPPARSVTATKSKERGNQVVTVAWSNFELPTVDISLNTEYQITIPTDDGSWQDNLGKKPTGDFTYEVCDSEGCADATVSY